MSQFEKASLQVRKYLLDMKPNEVRSVSVRLCAYTTLKSTAGQLKKLGMGAWKVNHRTGNITTTITRLN